MKRLFLLIVLTLALPSPAISQLVHHQGRIFDDTGSLVASASVDVHLAGTTTDATPLCVDVQCSSTRNNSFTAGADGTYDFWIESGVYDLTFTKAPFTIPSLADLEISRGVYDVRSYGALCDGSTDDKTAIKDALDAADRTGGTVKFPPGTCVVNSQINNSLTSY